MKMKKEKDIVEFFDHYSEQMLPEDGEQFMKKLKPNMDLLPVPSAFNKMDSELSKEYAEWLLAKMKRDNKRTQRDGIISCVFTSIITATALCIINALGILNINLSVTIGVLAVLTITFLALLYCLFPLRTKDFF